MSRYYRVDYPRGRKMDILLSHEKVSFRWSVRDNEIRLHTKEGGIIMGKIQGDTLEITLPGAKSMSFKKGPVS